tara:strand:- start:24 stop:245 length:222 start_codon:yes stop_codon:yes gene_type:complete
MAYIVLKDVMLKGKRFKASEVITDISLEDAASLLAIRRIEPVNVSEPVDAVDRSVGLSDETKPKKRAYKKRAK